MFRFRSSLSLAVWPAMTLAASAAFAGPTINNLSLRGLQVGGTVTLTIDGAGLLPEPRLLASMPIAKQTLREGGTPQHVEMEVTLAADVPPGIYQLRLANNGGVSAPLAVGVDVLPQLPMADKLDRLPVAMSGTIAGATIYRATFSGRHGDHVVIDAEARRLGSALNPVVRLYNNRRVQLAWAQGASALSGDARLDATLPADGTYTIDLHDAQYRGGNPGFFRLKVGNVSYANNVFPVGVQIGTKALLEYHGTNFPAGLQTEFQPTGAKGLLPAPWSTAANVTGGRPLMIVDDLPEVLEDPNVSAGSLQKAPAPCALNGRLLLPKEEDKYELQVTPGSKLNFEMHAARIGSPIDGVLTISNMQGAQLATGDDRPTTTDPGLDFTVPADVNAIVLAVKDLEGRGGADSVYRVAVSPAGEPDFSVTVLEDRVEAPQGGVALVRVKAARMGYQGAIRLNVPGLPGGLTMSTPEIPAGASDALVTISAPEADRAQLLASLTGEATVGQRTIVHEALMPPTSVTKHQPWLRKELALAVVGRQPVQVSWENVSPEDALPLGGSVPVKIKLARAAKGTGQVRLSLVTTQPVPKKKVNNKDVDDVDKMLRFDPAVSAAGEETTAQARLVVPADLKVMPYDLVVKAELLSDDGKMVRSTSYAVSRRLTPVKPATPPAEPLAIFEDHEEFPSLFREGAGVMSLAMDSKYSGKASLKVTPEQKFNPKMPNLAIKIRENPGDGEFRFARFAWRKVGGAVICLQLAHDGVWGPAEGKPAKFRYYSGPGAEPYGGSVQIDDKLPGEFAVVTRDLFADFGEFTLTGLGFSPVDGEYGLYDHLYLSRGLPDLDKVAPPPAK